MRRGLVRPGMHALDLATGTGYLARGLAQRGLTVTGLDIAPDMMDAAKALDAAQGLAHRLCRRQGGGNRPAVGTVRPGDGGDLLALVRPHEGRVRRCCGLLKPGGWLLICSQDWLPLGRQRGHRTETIVRQHNPNGHGTVSTG
jgi:SAM-dependent methyltransferase